MNLMGVQKSQEKDTEPKSLLKGFECHTKGQGDSVLSFCAVHLADFCFIIKVCSSTWEETLRPISASGDSPSWVERGRL